MSNTRFYHATVADDNGNIYVIGGVTIPTEPKAEKYDPSTDSWSTIASPQNNLEEINGVFIAGKIYIPGDSNNANLYIFDLSNGWQTLANKQSDGIANLPARRGYQVEKIGSKIYLMGGLIGFQALPIKYGC